MADGVSQQRVLFDARFLEKYAGNIISDTAVAIVELVANSWDAYATKVDITWPDRTANAGFAIKDDGKGMTRDEFFQRWSTLDYDKVAVEGDKVFPPEDLEGHPPRKPYGRNGKGRHAAFRFGESYFVRTWRDGKEHKFEILRGLEPPFEIKELGSSQHAAGHGTEISTTNTGGIHMTAEEAREILGIKFLADPNFRVSIGGTTVTFDDVPGRHLQREEAVVEGHGTAEIIVIDAYKSDKTTKQHGIAWRVQNRLVGSPGWVGFDHERILDGRTSEAKRFLFIVMADFLGDSVKADWSGFKPESAAWNATQPVVHDTIRKILSKTTAERRREAKRTVKESHLATVRKLPPASRERWTEFVDRVVDACPSISVEEVGQVAGILANLENATSKYGLLGKLHDLAPGDIDALDVILQDWTVRLAKDALDEIQGRLKLITELDQKLRDKSMDEVLDLQPLIGKSLWVFGPEYESIEFTSNKGMTTVIRQLFGSDERGTPMRPDFVIVPDGSVGLYSRDSYDGGGEVIGIEKLVIAEIKKVGVKIGLKEKNQPWQYVKELQQKGHVAAATEVTCFVLGSDIESGENSEVKHGPHTTVRPLTYSTFIRRAEKRMLGLREKLAEAPFLKQYLEEPTPVQPDLLEQPADSV